MSTAVLEAPQNNRLPPSWSMAPAPKREPTPEIDMSEDWDLANDPRFQPKVNVLYSSCYSRSPRQVLMQGQKSSGLGKGFLSVPSELGHQLRNLLILSSTSAAINLPLILPSSLADACVNTR